MKKFRIQANYEYSADEIIAATEEEAYDIFLANLDSYYVGLYDYSCEEEAEVCENCEVELEDCECEDEDD